MSLIDDADAVGDEAHHAQVVGDEEVRQLLLLLELLHEVEHLGADGYVQGRDGLIGHHHLRLHDHGPGDADALALATRKLVGVAGQMFRQEADLLDHVLHLLHPLGLTGVEVEVTQALGNDVVHGSPLIQAGCGVLEDHLDVADDLPVQGVGDLSGDAHALVVDLASGQGVDPDDGPADGGLARAGLAHQGVGLPLVDVKGGVLYGPHGVFALAESDVHILQGKENLLAGLLVDGAVRRQMGSAGPLLGILLLCSHVFSLP